MAPGTSPPAPKPATTPLTRLDILPADIGGQIVRLFVHVDELAIRIFRRGPLARPNDDVVALGGVLAEAELLRSLADVALVHDHTDFDSGGQTSDGADMSDLYQKCTWI